MAKSGILGLFEKPPVAQVERAIAEFRSGRPVVVQEGDELLIAIGVEALERDAAAELDAFAAGRGRLLLSVARLRKLGRARKAPGVVAFPALDLDRLEALSHRTDGKLDAPVALASAADIAALELAALALTLPSVFAIPATKAEAQGLVTVAAGDVMAFRARAAADMKLISRSPVPLELAPRSEFAVFRGGEGMRDQVAIIVGQPDLTKPVAVRMHSACLTGDLFGSLKCDCGDQLRHTVRQMAEGDGGVLLYLDQEGRGNGIANKMRAYALQAQGWDTYDADEALGFDLDQRHFDFAANMLKQLGVTSVRLLTNNPVKIAALKEAGLDVAADQRVHGRSTAENVRYLASKRDRAGHFIDFDQMAAHAPAQD